MCIPGLFGGGGGDGGASAARAAEEARQARINNGMDQINQQFSQFDEPYYAKQTKAYGDYYLPQVDQQYNNARRALILKLGSTGIINSSEGARQLGLLDKDYQTQRGSIGSKAVDQGTVSRNAVEDARSNLIMQLNSSADPAAAAQSATARVAALATPTAFSPLGDLFANSSQYLANRAYSGNPALSLPNQSPSALYSSSGSGSSRVVG